MEKCILCLIGMVIFVACKKDHTAPVQFPKETQEGLNTFGCYINDTAFIPSTTVFGNVRPVNVFYAAESTQSYKAGFLSIQGIDARASDVAGDLFIQKEDVFSTGDYSVTHVFNCSNYYDCDAGGYQNSKGDRFYYIDTGKLTITKLDTVNHIISGRFYFNSKDTLGNIKKVTGGVFDAKYTY